MPSRFGQFAIGGALAVLNWRRRRFELRDYERELPRLLSRGGVESVQIERDTLEDVMLRLVEESEG